MVLDVLTSVETAVEAIAFTVGMGLFIWWIGTLFQDPSEATSGPRERTSSSSAPEFHYWSRGEGWCIDNNCKKALVASWWVDVTFLPKPRTVTTGILFRKTETRTESDRRRFWDAKAIIDGSILRIVSISNDNLLAAYPLTNIQGFFEGRSKYHEDEVSS